MGDDVGLAAAYDQLGNAARRAGRTVEARESYEAAAALYRRIDDTAGLAAALNNIGGLAQSLGSLPEAITAAEEALLLHRAAGDVGGQVSAENTVGWALRDLGRPEEALLRLRAAARLARESGDRYLIGANANRVGGVYLALGRIDEAIVSGAGAPDRFDGSTVRIRTGTEASKADIERLAAHTTGLSCRFLHIATHGILDPLRSQFSGLLFSRDAEAPEADGSGAPTRSATPGFTVRLSCCPP